QDKTGRSVGDAKPTSYYYRAGQPDNSAGIGGLYDVLGPNNFFVEDASYVKLREIALNYSLPGSITRRFGMSGIDLRLAGRNLKTWSDYTGFDPETNLGGGTNQQGVDYYNNPQTRQFILSVNLNR
ncbi:MAG TPA: hypothetical protein VK399_18155, partial [Longimicrobiaceae bacterium]|nr:hypothetical protein [Longimicrobiaceae bacterium]